MTLLGRLKSFTTGTPLRTLISSLLVALLIPVTLFANSQRWELRRQAAEVPKAAAYGFSRFAPGAEYVPGELIVKFRETKEVELNAQALSEVSTQYGALAIQPLLERVKTYKMVFPNEADLKAKAEELAKDPLIEYAEPNYIFRISQDINDPYFLDPEPPAPERALSENEGGWSPTNEDESPLPYQWGLRQIGFDKALDVLGANEVVVAVIDTGLDYNHPDIKERVWKNTDEISGNGRDDDGNGYVDDFQGWDGVDYSWQGYQKTADNDPMDDWRENYFDYWEVPHLVGGGHGTHVAGVIAATAGNGVGVAGLNNHAKIMALRACDALGACETDDLAEMIYYAIDNGARVINMSWGGHQVSQTIASALEDAFDHGMVLVAASGNDPSRGVSFPASHPKVIAVSATNERDVVTVYSGWGEEVGVAAPGGDGSLWGIEFRNESSVLSLRAEGTDMACPYEESCWMGEVEHTSLVVGGDQKYYRASGTSMAAPHVAGLASLLLSKNPSLANQQVEEIVKLSADDILDPGRDLQSGFGRINIERALREYAEKPPPVAVISEPYDSEHLYYGTIEIKGSAAGDGFLNFRLDYAPAADPNSWSASGMQLVGAGAAAVANGVLGAWDTGNLEGQFFLRLTLNRTDGPPLTHQVVVELVNQSLKTGWPKVLPNEAALDPLITDLNGDGQKEIVFAVGNKVYGLRANGESVSSVFPVTLSSAARRIAVGEVDGNSPGKEIVVEVIEGLGERPKVKVIRFSGSITTIASQQEFLGVLADVDGNRVNEVLTLVRPSQTAEWWLHALSLHTGSNVNSFPVRLDDPQNCPSCFLPYAAPEIRVGDLNGDQREDVVFAVNGGGPWSFTRLVAVSGTGEILWQKDLFRAQRKFNTPLVLADLNQDGAQEVIVYNTNWEEWGGEPAEPVRRELYVWRGDGQPFFAEPNLDLYESGINRGVLHPVNLEGDGAPEILLAPVEDGFSRLDNVVVIKNDGTVALKSVADLAVRPGGQLAAIGDLGNDGTKEFLVGQKVKDRWSVGLLSYANGNFEETAGWPKSLIAEYGAWGGSGATAHPILADLEGDGPGEIVLPYCLRRKASCFLYVLTSGDRVGELDWPQSLHDERHTGAFTLAGPPLCIPGSKLAGDTNCDCKVNIFDLVRVGANYGKSRGDSTWDPLADIRPDGVINIFDLVLVGINYGKSCPPR